MSKKKQINYIKADGTVISFRESMAAFAPKEEEFKNLRTKIVEIIGKETTPEFDDTLDYLITFLRNKAFIHATTPSITAMQKELNLLTKHITKLKKLLESGTSEITEMHVSNALIVKMSDTGCADPLYALHCNATLALEVYETALENIRSSKPAFTPHDMRQVLAEELARELSNLGIEPKKYRDGDFANILKAILKMISCTVHGQRISISIPNDLFKVICDAIDEFPNKERYSLLELD